VFVNAAKYFKTCVDPKETLERVEAIARWLRNTTLLKRVFESSIGIKVPHWDSTILLPRKHSSRLLLSFHS